KLIMEGRPIDIYNNGDMYRDFTYIDDIVAGIVALIGHSPGPALPDFTGNSKEAGSPYRLYNIGNNKPISLLTFISVLEKHLGREARKNLLPMQPGDVYRTCADISRLSEEIGYDPQTGIEDGLEKFVAWFMDYYHTA
ncbi:MAG: GDP-mannose 4,6-dehydratase, partial [Spirochaetota bacterium]